jgi:hypothetical protein
MKMRNINRELLEELSQLPLVFQMCSCLRIVVELLGIEMERNKLSLTGRSCGRQYDRPHSRIDNALVKQS